MLYVHLQREGCLVCDPLPHRGCVQTMWGIGFHIERPAAELTPGRGSQVLEESCSDSRMGQAPLMFSYSTANTSLPLPPPVSLPLSHSAEKYYIMSTLKEKCLNKSCCLSQNIYRRLYSEKIDR